MSSFDKIENWNDVLQKAVEEQHACGVEFALRMGATVDEDLLLMAVGKRNAEVVEAILIHSTEPICRGERYTVLLKVVKNLQVDILAKFLAMDASDAKSNDPFHVASVKLHENSKAGDSVSLLSVAVQQLETGTDRIRCTTPVAQVYAIVELLLKHGADPNDNYGGSTGFATEDYMFPIHYVSSLGDYPTIVSLFIQYKADLYVQNNDGDTPLHLACYNRHLETAKLLLQAGADPNIPNKKYDTAYSKCLVQSKVPRQILAWLTQEAGADPSPLIAARPTGEPGLFRLFGIALEQSADEDLEYEQSDDEESDDDDSRCNRGDPDLSFFQLMLAQGMGLDRSQNGETILHKCVGMPTPHDEDDPDYHSDDQCEDDRPAFRYNFLNELLTNYPALVHTRDVLGNTPLHVVRHMPVCTALKKHGALLNVTNNAGRTPLIEAVIKGKSRVVKFLLQNMNENGGLDINGIDKDGWTALHWAVFHHHDKCIKHLLEFGARVDVRNHHGRNPLHLAGYAFRVFPTNIRNDIAYTEILRPADSYKDIDIQRVVNTHRFPAEMAKEDQVWYDGFVGETGLDVLLEKGADANQIDHHGNLPFFLAAATSRVSETFVVLRSAATSGLFDGL